MKPFLNNKNSYIDPSCDKHQCFLIKRTSTQKKSDNIYSVFIYVKRKNITYLIFSFTIEMRWFSYKIFNILTYHYKSSIFYTELQPQIK